MYFLEGSDCGLRTLLGLNTVEISEGTNDNTSFKLKKSLETEISLN